MDSKAQLQASIRSNQQNAAAARNRAQALQGQANQLQTEIAELERQLSELRSFKGTALRDVGDVESQLQDRRRIIDAIGELQNVAMAKQLVESISGSQFPQARSLLNRGCSMASDEIQKGERDLERRIEDLRSRLRSLQVQVSQQKSLAASYDRNAQNASRSLQELQINNA